MKALLIIILLWTNLCFGQSENYYFPPLTGWEWDTVSPASLGWCTEEADTLLEFLENNNTKAFILLQDGKIALEKYFGSFKRDSLWYWASAGKTLTAFLTGSAQEDGFLSINDLTSQYLGTGWTNCPPEKEDLITVRHQLTMSSGLDDGVQDPYCTLDTCLEYLSNAGTRWAYHNAPYTLLENVIENASGQNYNVYLYDKINSHTGMNGVFLPSGYNNIYFSNARSMARFGLLILNNGIWNNDTLMSDTVYFHDMVTTSQQLNLSYGYLWWLNGKESFMLPGTQFVFNGPLFPDAPDDMFAAMGKNGQLINVVPGLGTVFIRMGNNPEGSNDISPIFNNAIWQLLNNLMCNINEEEEIPAVAGLSFNIFPNPCENIIYIQSLKQIEHHTVRVFDVIGNKLFEGEDNQTLQTGRWSGGIYFLQVEYQNEIMNVKIIKK
jgi:CubicO group peptidase (beta-lactamase class C family)